MATSRSQIRKAEKRQRILQSATRIFARNGFYKTRVADIAREANVADGTIYLYFKNKDDVLISIFEETVGSIVPQIRGRLESIDSPADQLRVFIREHLRLVEAHPDLAAVLQLELRQSNTFMKEYSGTSFNDYLNVIVEIIESGQRRGVFTHEITPALAKRMLFGALDEISTLWVLLQEHKFKIEDCAAQISRLFLGGMLNERSPGG